MSELARRLRLAADGLEMLERALGIAPTGEPVPLTPTPPPESAGWPNANAAGVKGADMPAVTLTNANAADLLRLFKTRPVAPSDLAEVVAEAAADGGCGIKGMDAVRDPADNTPLTADVIIMGRKTRCVFLDKRGPVLLVRPLGAAEPYSVGVKTVDPARREHVCRILDALPGADDGFNFDPFEGESDPWVTPAATTAVTSPPNDVAPESGIP